MGIGVVLLKVIHGILLVFLLLAGIGSMPSVMGMLFLMLAVLLTPRKVLDFWLGDWWCRTVCIAALLIYWGRIPIQDVDMAGENMGRFLLMLRKELYSILRI